MSDALLICGPGNTPALRHELGFATSEALVFAELDGTRYVVASALTRPHLEINDALTVLAYEEVGFDPALSRGVTPDAEFPAAVVRLSDQLGLDSLIVPPEFPLDVADALRTAGKQVTADRELFAHRRRVKNSEERDAVRRAQRVAEEAMSAVIGLLRSPGTATSEELRREAWRTFVDNGCAPAPKLVIASGPQSADLHAAGTGPVAVGAPILLDIYPQDLQTGCWGDLSRTVCLGSPDAQLSRMHDVVCRVLTEVARAARPGQTGHALALLAHEIFIESGYEVGPISDSNTQATFPHILGHGLGLELHEPPYLDTGGVALVAGDIITVEPGLYRRGWGGVRMEDVLLITTEGSERITRFGYELQLG